MKVEDLSSKLHEMGSSEATALGTALETIWWETKTDDEAKDLAIEYLKVIQGWAKKAEEVLMGVRADL